MTPSISVIMPARNAAAHLRSAMDAVLAQTHAELELLVIDDGSQDETAAIVEAASAADPRVRLLVGPGRGPGAARNVGLAHARGLWAAVVDADDLLERDRFDCLLALTTGEGWQLVADNLTAFYSDGRPDHVWLAGEDWAARRRITLEEFLLVRPDAELGYLKPMFDLAWLRARNLSYDESLLVGEDYDLVLRVLAEGGRYGFSPQAGYRYRRHQGSVSHRIAAVHLKAMAAAMSAIAASLPEPSRSLAAGRLTAIEADLAFADLIDDLKSRRFIKAGALLRSRSLRRRLAVAAWEGLGRRLRSRRRATLAPINRPG